MTDLRALLTLLLGSLAACHSEPSEPTTRAPARDESPSHQDAHRIIEADHRHILHMRRDDRILPPLDPAFDWHIALEDPSAFAHERASAPDGTDGGGLESYRLIKAGPYRMMVYGDPKCLKREGGCGLSKRRWDVTVDVR